MRSIITLSICFVSIFVSCQESKDSAANETKPSFQEIKEQYLLTNEIDIKQLETVSGASGFLVKINDQVYMGTAKHLLSPAMGFKQPIDLPSYNDSVNHWIAFPRTNALANDTISLGKLLYPSSDADGILLTVNEPIGDIQVLDPNYTTLEKGTRLRVLGCEYATQDCYQSSFFGTLNAYTDDGFIEVDMDSSDIQVSGFSGAPVLDIEDKVIGHISAGGVFEGILTLYIVPIGELKKLCE